MSMVEKENEETDKDRWIIVQKNVLNDRQPWWICRHYEPDYLWLATVEKNKKIKKSKPNERLKTTEEEKRNIA